MKVDPGNPGAWINLAYSVRAERIEQAEAILLKACVLHPRLSRLRPAIDLDKDIRRLSLDVVAAISLGHRGDTVFSPSKSPCALVSLFPFGKFFFR